MRIICPVCGERDRREFRVRGAAVALDRPDPSADLSEWDDHLHLRDNPAGATRELWCHEFGCSAWIVVTRDTTTHAVRGCELAGRPVWRDDLAAFVPRAGAVPGLRAAGACNGTFSTHGALREGADAAREALDALGRRMCGVEMPRAEDAPVRLSPLWAVAGRGRAWLDFQNDVTVRDVQQAARENFRSVGHMKRYTTQGMATDQGRNSNMAALAVLADATGRSIDQTGTTTYRPPYSPVAIAALGAGAQGKGFAPRRLTTSHRASTERGAPMMEAGLWCGNTAMGMLPRPAIRRRWAACWRWGFSRTARVGMASGSRWSII